MCAMINRAAAGPVRLVLVTGHAFGIRAFEGIFASSAFLDGNIAVSLLIGLDESRAAATVGFSPLSRLAAEQGVPYIGTFDGRLSSLADRIRDIGPAYLIVIGWSYLVATDILSIPAAGSIGMHPSPLPLGRGQAPIPWTIIKGLKRTALSVFFLAEAADAGPVIARYDLDVRDNETSASLFYRVGHVHFTAGLDLAERIGGGAVTAQAQDEAAATRWPRRRPADGEIKPAMTTAEIEALVRPPCPLRSGSPAADPVPLRRRPGAPAARRHRRLTAAPRSHEGSLSSDDRYDGLYPAIHIRLIARDELRNRQH